MLEVAGIGNKLGEFLFYVDKDVFRFVNMRVRGRDVSRGMGGGGTLGDDMDFKI